MVSLFRWNRKRARLPIADDDRSRLPTRGDEYRILLGNQARVGYISLHANPVRNSISISVPASLELLPAYLLLSLLLVLLLP